MKFKKIAAGIIAAAVALALTGCAKNIDFDNIMQTIPQNGQSSGKLPAVQLPDIPVNDASAFGYRYDRELDGMVITDYKLQSPKVHIPEKLENENVVKVEFGGVKKDITHIIMPDTVKEFNLSDQIKRTLQFVNIPDGVTSIRENAFENCTSLASVTIGNSVTVIGSGAFSGCTNLTSVTIGNGVTKIEWGAFENCENLASITIPDSVTEIAHYAFSGCKSLASVTIGNSVTVIGRGAFNKCTNLTSVMIPDGVTTIYTADMIMSYEPFVVAFDPFSGCGNIQATYKGKTYDYDHIDLLYDAINFGESDMLIENGVLKDVSRDLTKVVIPDGVTKIGEYAFSGCTSLTSITIPDSVTEIGNYAFSGCENIQTATYKGKTFDYEHIDGLYDAIMLGENCMRIENGILKGVSNYATERLTKAVIPNSVTEIGSNAFEGCASLTSVTIPDSVTKIGENTFNGCENIQAATYKGKTFDYEHIGGLYDTINFGESGMLIENGVLKDVSRGLSEVVIPDSVTEIGIHAFSGCKSLASITIPSSVIHIYCDFKGCTSLKSAIIGADDGVTTIRNSTFSGCTSLTSVTIGDGVTTIDKFAFNSCTNLTSVTIGNGVTKIGEQAFGDCTSLTNITLPDSVTKIAKNTEAWEILGDRGTFYNCENIQATYKGKTYDYAHIDDLYRAINSN